MQRRYPCRTHLLALLALSVALCGCAMQPVVGHPRSGEATDDIAADFRHLVGAWENGDVGSLDDSVDISYRGHTSTGERNRDGLKARIEKFHSLYTDVHFAILEQIVSGDRVATRLEATCREAASGASIHMYGMNISIIRNGKLFEEWAVWEVRPSGG